MTTKRRRKGWEPPLFEWSQLGPIPVHLVPEDDPALDEGKSWGMADLAERVIYLDSSLPSQQMRVVLHHEWMHFVIQDAGLGEAASEETVVQTIATALVARENFHAAGGVPEVKLRDPR
jgi:hypothetical protein